MLTDLPWYDLKNWFNQAVAAVVEQFDADDDQRASKREMVDASERLFDEGDSAGVLERRRNRVVGLDIGGN
ncbi:MAG: hypothetical protein AAF216_04685 [Pseudomonadota bacterium]